MKRYIIITLVAWTCNQALQAGVPNWTVNPADYTNSMSMVGAIKIDGQESLDENDMVAAFIGGELRGVAQVQYEQAADRFIAFLIIYSNESGGDVSFKMYDASADTEQDAFNSTTFVINGLEGDLANPILWSNVILNSENEITAFSFAEIDGEVTISSESIVVPVGFTTDLSVLMATFSVTTGATVWVEDAQQISGQSSNDFSDPLVFTVISEDEQNRRSYSVEVFNTNNPPTDVMLDNLAIDENSVVGTEVGVLSVEDDDDEHTYFIVEGIDDDDNTLFEIENDQLLVKAGFDFEVKSSYSIRVKVVDGAGQELEKVFLIGVDDLNEIPTDIIPSTVSFKEHTAMESTIATLSTIDQDENDSFTYSLSGTSEDNSFFTVIDNQLVSSKTFNFEEQYEFSIHIAVEDAGKNVYEKVIQFTVADENDTPSDIILGNQTVPENLAIGILVSEITTLDEDELDTHFYTLVDGEGADNNDQFYISGNKVMTKATFDFETKDSFSLRLETNDKNGGIFQEIFEIDILDTNDNPTALKIDVDILPENMDSGSRVGEFSIEDVDLVQPTYSLIPGSNDNDKFIINGSELQSLRAFDFELENKFFIDVQATDGSDGIIVKRFEINISDANDTPNEVILSANKVGENQVAGTEVGLFDTDDQDKADIHTYSLVSGEGDVDNQSFQIVNNILQTTTVFDFEVKNEYQIRVKSTDGSGASLDHIFIINIRDQGDVPTDIQINSVEIDEESPKGSIVGVLNTVDEDTQDEFTYTMSEGEGDTDNSDFGIDGNRLVSRTVFDAESKIDYSVRIKVVDSGGNTVSKSYAISILPINELPKIEAQEFSVEERSSNATSVGTVTAFDIDGDDLSFSILDSGLPFEINSITGEISVSSTLDYEDAASHVLEVQVTDLGGLSDVAEITVVIEDIIESELPLPANDFVSANNDGFNDLFKIQNVNLYQDYRLIIFNNSGAEVFSTEGYNNNWSGIDNSGRELAAGVYYYSFISPSNPISFKGAITLVR